MPRLLPLSLLLLAATAQAQSTAPLTIEQVMADPDWIGPSVEQAWWQWNGKQVQYQLKREGSPVRDTYRQPAAGGTAAERVADTARAGLDAANPSYDAGRQRMLFARNGDIFLRDLRSGALTQLTRSNEVESRPQFASDGGAIWRAGNNWYHWRADGGTAQVAVVKAERDPNAAPEADVLREQQLATLATLRRDREQREALRTQDDAWRRTDSTRAPAPVYLGDEVEIVDSALSPDERHLLVVTQALSLIHISEPTRPY